MKTNPDEQQVFNAQSDPESFGKLYDHYYPRVLNFFAHRTGDPHLAADLTGDTFYAALKGIKNLKIHHHNSFSAWLFKIADNTLKKHYKLSYRLPVISWFIEKFDPPAPSIQIPLEEMKAAEEILENSSRIKKIRSTLLALKPSKYRQILSMFYFDKMSIIEISAITNMSESNVKTTLSRARKKLKIICNEEL